MFVVAFFWWDTPERTASATQDDQSHSTRDTRYMLMAARLIENIECASLLVAISWAYHYGIACQSMHDNTYGVLSSRKAI